MSYQMTSDFVFLKDIGGDLTSIGKVLKDDNGTLTVSCLKSLKIKKVNSSEVEDYFSVVKTSETLANGLLRNSIAKTESVISYLRVVEGLLALLKEHKKNNRVLDTKKHNILF